MGGGATSRRWFRCLDPNPGLSGASSNCGGASYGHGTSFGSEQCAREALCAGSSGDSHGRQRGGGAEETKNFTSGASSGGAEQRIRLRPNPAAGGARPQGVGSGGVELGRRMVETNSGAQDEGA